MAAWDDLLFAVRRSVRYHHRRMRFFDLVGKWANGLSIVFGSAAVASILGDDHKVAATGAALLIVVVQTIDLIIGSSKVARDHSDLARRFVVLEAEMAKAHQSPETLKGFEVKRLEIEGDEPPIMRMLDVLCHNELAKAQGSPDGDLYRVTWLKRRLAQFISFDTHGLKRLSEPAS